MKRILLGILLISALVLSGCSGETIIKTIETTKTISGITTTKTITKTVTQAYNPTTAATGSFSPISFSGSSDENTAPFTVTTDIWKIEWSYTPEAGDEDWALFSFFIYPKGETVLYVGAVLFPSSTSGSTYCYEGAGQYYISVGCASISKWNIKISPA